MMYKQFRIEISHFLFLPYICISELEQEDEGLGLAAVLAESKILSLRNTCKL